MVSKKINQTMKHPLKNNQLVKWKSRTCRIFQVQPIEPGEEYVYILQSLDGDSIVAMDRELDEHNPD